MLDGLAGKAADDEGDVTLTGLYTYASSHTKKYVAQKFSGFQTPALEGKIDANFELCRIDRNASLEHPMQPPGDTPPATAGKVFTNSIGMKLALIPAGEFMMGSLETELGYFKKHEAGEKRHKVRITRPFYLGVFEVTQAEYQSVMEKNPSDFSATGKSALLYGSATPPGSRWRTYRGRMRRNFCTV